MRPSRHILVILLAAGLFGSLALTGGYAWYLRSDTYRASCAAVLQESLGLPSAIARVVPRSWTAREFQNVRVWLPQRRDEAAYIERAILRSTPQPNNPDAYELQLINGRCEVSTRTWLRADYRRMLESGLKPGFDPDGPRRVVFSGMNLAFSRDQFQAALHDASGVVEFVYPDHGEAAITCRQLNGHETAQAVTLHADFSPQTTRIQLDRVQLAVPWLPLRALNLGHLAGINPQEGAFRGHLTYREVSDDRTVLVSGQVRNLALADVSAPYFPRPWRGTAREIELTQLKVRNGTPERLHFSGRIDDVVLEDILAPWGITQTGGDVELHVRVGELSTKGIDHLVVVGRCENVVLDGLVSAFYSGRMHGKATVVIDDLTIIDNHVHALDATVTVPRASEDQPNWIERTLLSEVLADTMGIALPTFLPERFEFVELGVRLELRDEVLVVFGTHGPNESTILTIDVGGYELPIVNEPEAAFDLSPVFAALRARMADTIRERWGEFAPLNTFDLRGAPHSQPTTAQDTE